MLVYFVSKGIVQVQWFNTNTREIEFKSGYKLPVMDNGYISYLGETIPVYDLDGNLMAI